MEDLAQERRAAGRSVFLLRAINGLLLVFMARDGCLRRDAENPKCAVALLYLKMH